jgi:2,4-dienoyl-CoA reductase-like NADH-dependent reductase (Old Yellow Enzyme family)
MPNLFTPFRIKDVELKNRIAVSPMCQYSSIDGFANDWHMVHLGSRAIGGAALVLTEAAAVSPEGRITASDLGIWKDEHIDLLKKITRFIHQQNAVSGIQLAHAGRKASHREPWNSGTMVAEKDGGWLTVAPSPIPFSTNGYAPAALTEPGIQKVINDFQAAAKRALIAGFMVIEIHAAHGYLINEFLSPLTNKRTDKYGGSFENRIRFLLEIIQAIKKVWPENYPLLLRISSSDWVEGGWTIDDSVALGEVVKLKGIDVVDCSSGGVVPDAKIVAVPGYQVPFAEAIKSKTGISTGAVGIIVTPEQAEEIITSGKADMVFLAREMLRDPNFPLRAAYELGYDITWPVQYERARRRKK